MSNIFAEITANSHTENARRFEVQLRKAVRLLMEQSEGRVFLRWLGQGQSAQTMLQLIMDYEEEQCLSKRK